MRSSSCPTAGSNELSLRLINRLRPFAPDCCRASLKSFRPRPGVRPLRGHMRGNAGLDFQSQRFGIFQRNQRMRSLPVASATPQYPYKVRRLPDAKSGSTSIAYEFRTKSAQSGGLETNGPRERISGLDGPVAVRRFAREARGYWASLRARRWQRMLVV